MRNWKDFLFRKYDGAYEWTPTSEAFYKTIKQFINKDDKILEFGGATGHISYRLAKENYNITSCGEECTANTRWGGFDFIRSRLFGVRSCWILSWLLYLLSILPSLVCIP